MTEVLVVLVIVSICFGMVVVSVTARPADHRLQTAAAELANWVRSATALAAERGEVCALRYDLDEGGLTAHAEGRPDDRHAEIMTHRMPAHVRIERVVWVRDELGEARQGQVEMAVYPDGTCEPHLVIVTEAGIGSCTLEVNPVTGDVTVFDGKRDYERVQIENVLGAAAR